MSGPAERAGAFADLSEEIRRCTRCPLSQSRTHAVVYRGSLAPRIVFVGEAPGAAEDREGVPFVGRSGRFLDRAIEGLGPRLGEYGILNLLKCRPPANRFDRKAAAVCRPFLDRQLELLAPRALVPLGANAWRSLVPDGGPILAAAGRAFRLGPGWAFPLLHPAAALRATRWRERWEHDLLALARWLERAPFEML